MKCDLLCKNINVYFAIDCRIAQSIVMKSLDQNMSQWPETSRVANAEICTYDTLVMTMAKSFYLLSSGMTTHFINSIYRLTSAINRSVWQCGSHRLSFVNRVVSLPWNSTASSSSVRNPVIFIFGDHSLPLIAWNICSNNQKQTF